MLVRRKTLVQNVWYFWVQTVKMLNQVIGVDNSEAADIILWELSQKLVCTL